MIIITLKSGEKVRTQNKLSVDKDKFKFANFDSKLDDWVYTKDIQNIDITKD